MRETSEWIYRLSPGQIDELESAMRATQARGLDIADIGQSEFPLPTFGPELLAIRDEIVSGRGFALIRGIPVERYTIAEAAAIYYGIGTWLGNARSQNAKGHVLGHVRDLGLSAEKDPNVRIYQTTERQTYHTDSCDMVGLLCLKTAKSGGFSSIVSSMTIYNAMATKRPELVKRLLQQFATDRRGEVPAGKKPYFELPVFNDHAGNLSVIYARRYLASEIGNAPWRERVCHSV